MNSINVGGKKLKVVRFNEPLYRANRGKLTKFDPSGSMAVPNYLASEEYNTYTNKNGVKKRVEFKYFTLHEDELKAYTKENMPWMKKWQPQSELVLIDILDMPTRRALAELIGSESLNFSFPIKGNKVSRVSEENERHHDDAVLKALCDLGLDGYYMKRLTKNNGEYVFHSEVGLCRRAFSKLRVEKIEKAKNAPRAPTRRAPRPSIEPPNSPKSNKKTRRNLFEKLVFGKPNNNNDKSKINNFTKFNFTIKKPRSIMPPPKALSFDNLEENSK